MSVMTEHERREHSSSPAATHADLRPGSLDMGWAEAAYARASHGARRARRASIRHARAPRTGPRRLLGALVSVAVVVAVALMATVLVMAPNAGTPSPRSHPGVASARPSSTPSSLARIELRSPAIASSGQHAPGLGFKLAPLGVAPRRLPLGLRPR